MVPCISISIDSSHKQRESERERERERESEQERKRESERVCVCVRERERERERTCLYAGDRTRVCERDRARETFHCASTRSSQLYICMYIYIHQYTDYLYIYICINVVLRGWGNFEIRTLSPAGRAPLASFIWKPRCEAKQNLQTKLDSSSKWPIWGIFSARGCPSSTCPANTLHNC